MLTRGLPVFKCNAAGDDSVIATTRPHMTKLESNFAALTTTEDFDGVHGLGFIVKCKTVRNLQIDFLSKVYDIPSSAVVRRFERAALTGIYTSSNCPVPIRNYNVYLSLKNMQHVPFMDRIVDHRSTLPMRACRYKNEKDIKEAYYKYNAVTGEIPYTYIASVLSLLGHEPLQPAVCPFFESQSDRLTNCDPLNLAC